MPSEKAEVTSHTGSGDFNCYLTSTIRSIQTSLPTREVGISTVRIFKGRGHLASHFPHGKWGFQHGGPSWGQVQPCHFPHGKWGFQPYLPSHRRLERQSLPTREVGISTTRSNTNAGGARSLPVREARISTTAVYGTSLMDGSLLIRGVRISTALGTASSCQTRSLLIQGRRFKTYCRRRSPSTLNVDSRVGSVDFNCLHHSPNLTAACCARMGSGD